MVSELKMEERVKFDKGKQRKFLDDIVKRLNCVSLRSILQFGFNINYSSLKNYYTERRLLPRGFFENLCRIGKIELKDLNFEFIKGNFGQVKGGKRSKRGKEKRRMKK